MCVREGDVSEAYPDLGIVKRLVSQLPWGHLIRLLQHVKEPAVRDWYVRQAIANGWSRSVLESCRSTPGFRRITSLR